MMKRHAKRLSLFALLMAGAACTLGMPGGSGGGATTGGGAMAERLVLGGNMSFDECQARGGLIIRDAGNPMVACDPRVRRRAKAPADEFAHPPQ